VSVLAGEGEAAAREAEEISHYLPVFQLQVVAERGYGVPEDIASAMGLVSGLPCGHSRRFRPAPIEPAHTAEPRSAGGAIASGFRSLGWLTPQSSALPPRRWSG
jgi:hypothetical protein